MQASTAKSTPTTNFDRGDQFVPDLGLHLAFQVLPPSQRLCLTKPKMAMDVWFLDWIHDMTNHRISPLFFLSLFILRLAAIPVSLHVCIFFPGGPFPLILMTTTLGKAGDLHHFCVLSCCLLFFFLVAENFVSFFFFHQQYWYWYIILRFPV